MADTALEKPELIDWSSARRVAGLAAVVPSECRGVWPLGRSGAMAVLTIVRPAHHLALTEPASRQGTLSILAGAFLADLQRAIGARARAILGVK